MMNFSGPTARQDAERAEKSRWLAHLAALLVGTQTPLGQRLVEKPATCNSMGLGLRSGTLRNRIHYDAGLATTTRLHRGLVASGSSCWTQHSVSTGPPHSPR